MTFPEMIGGLFASDLAEDVVYRANGVLPGVTIRGIPVAPDVDAGRFDLKARTTARMVDVNAADVPFPTEADLIVVGGITYQVRAPAADELRLTWRLTLKAL